MLKAQKVRSSKSVKREQAAERRIKKVRESRERKREREVT